MNNHKRKTQLEIFRLAYVKNYQILYRAIQAHDYDSEISWEEVMEAAALALSEQNAELQAELLRIHQTSVIKIIGKPGNEQIIQLDGLEKKIQSMKRCENCLHEDNYVPGFCTLSGKEFKCINYSNWEPYK